MGAQIGGTTWFGHVCLIGWPPILNLIKWAVLRALVRSVHVVPPCMLLARYLCKVYTFYFRVSHIGFHKYSGFIFIFDLLYTPIAHPCRGFCATGKLA